MSEGNDTDFDAADDRLFSGKPLEELDADTVVTVEADAEDGFEQPVEDPNAQEPQQEAPVQTTGEDDSFQGLPPAAIAAIKDERKKRQAATGELQSMRDELNQLRGRLEAQPVQQPQQQRAPQIPNPATDPEGYHAFMQSQQAAEMQNTQLNMSEMMVRQSLGDEAVNEAFSALSQHPQRDLLMSQFRQTTHPWGQMVSWYKQQKLVTEIGDDPEAYKLKLKEELLAEMRQTPAAQQAPSTPQTPNLPPRVANTPGAMPGGAAQHTMDDAENNLWGR
jgi:hypothetical protein